MRSEQPLCGTFRKRERLVSRKLAEELFGGAESRALAAWPLRAVYRLREREQGDEVAVQVMVSVPKKRLHHAVDRNRVKRQVREAYRLNKQLLTTVVPPTKQVVVAFIWQNGELSTTDVVVSRMKGLLRRIAEKVNGDCEK